MNNLIEERDERTKRRKKFKQKIDKVYNLSYKDDEKMMLSADGVMKLSDTSIRLLDEGAVVGDDFVSFIIKKGTLEKFMNGNNESLPNLDPSQTYPVNLGHQDFATFPFIIGEFRKSDLSLVDIGDDRKGIDVALHLDEESVFVQELKRQPYDIGVSAEFNYRVDWDTTFEIGILVIDEVYIFAYGLVGECGNVNSSGLELKGETVMPDNIEIREEEMAAENEAMNLDAESELEIAPSAEEETPTEPEPETEEECTWEEHQDESEEAEAEETEEGEEPDGDEGEDEEADELAEVLATVKDLKEQVETLSNTIRSLEETNASLKKTNRKLSGKLQRENERKREFLDGVKGLSVQLFPYEDKEAETKSKKESSVTKGYYEDGIGEL